MIYNYHTHTKRCGHAFDDEEEYIKNAIKNGIRYMGFSDHFPLRFPDGFEARYRMPLSSVRDYFECLNALKEKYKQQIEIKIGFEMEFYPELFDKMFVDAKSYGAEYLILGQHFYEPEHYGGFYVNTRTDSKEHLQRYADTIILAMQKKVFTYLAHPDLFNFTGDDALYDEQMRKICKASVKYNTPLEINFLGIRALRHYPNEAFWSIAGEEGSPVTFGFDAHDAKGAYDGQSLSVALQMISKYNLNYIGMPKLINL